MGVVTTHSQREAHVAEILGDKIVEFLDFC